MKTKKRRGDEALSDVISAILMLALAVSLFSIIYISFQNVTFEKPGPSVDIVGYIDDNNVIIEHKGGEALDLDTHILLRIGSNLYNLTVSDYLDSDAISNGLWNIGEKFVYPAGDISGLQVKISMSDNDRFYMLLSGVIQDGALISPTVNVDPEISNPSPSNGSIDINILPQLSIDVSDDNGDTLNISWFSNSSGSWELFGNNLSIGDGVYYQNNSNFSGYSTKYWWRVNLSDGNSGFNEEIYHFTTEETVILNTSVDIISPYETSSNPLTITATSDGVTPDNITLYYRYSTDNTSWGETQNVAKICTWTHNSGTINIGENRDNWKYIPFNNQVNANEIYTQDLANINITLGEDGHYLVLYHLMSTTDYNNRMGFESRIVLNDTAIPGSYSSDYTRRSSDDELSMTGGAIINANLNDKLRIETCYRTDRGDQTHTLVNNKCSLQILKLNDTWDYCILEKTSNQQMTTANSWDDITWETEIELDGNSFTHTENSDEIILEQEGHYLMIAGAAFDSTGRNTLEIRSNIGGEVSEFGRGYSYARGSNDHREANPWTIAIINVSEDDVLYIEMANTQSESARTSNTNEENMGIMLVKLPDDANYYIGHGDDSINPSESSTYEIVDTVDTEVEEDVAYNGNQNGQITINSGYEGNYLFLFSGTGTRSGTSGTRSIPHLEWFVNDSDLNLGGPGWYTRGNQGSQDCFRGGDASGIIWENSGTGTIELKGREYGSGGSDQDRLDDNEYGIMAVYLDDIFQSQGSGDDIGWLLWSNINNPDTSSPWSWDFDFSNGTGYYEFYSIGKKSGLSDENIPTNADSICRYIS